MISDKRAENNKSLQNVELVNNENPEHPKSHIMNDKFNVPIKVNLQENEKNSKRIFIYSI